MDKCLKMENGWIMIEDDFQKENFLVQRKGDERDYVIYIYSEKDIEKCLFHSLFYSQEYPGKRIYVSTHGLGVSYFHLRLEPIQPKYYKP